MAFEKIKFAMKTWKDAVSGGTPITAAELNRIEKGISDTAKGVNDLGDSVSLEWWGQSVSFNLETAKTFAIVTVGITNVPLKGPFMVWFSSTKPQSTRLPDGISITNDGRKVTVSHSGDASFFVQKFSC